jgi:hypothetical protein
VVGAGVGGGTLLSDGVTVFEFEFVFEFEVLEFVFFGVVE